MTWQWLKSLARISNLGKTIITLLRINNTGKRVEEENRRLRVLLVTNQPTKKVGLVSFCLISKTLFTVNFLNGANGF
jgi:hypothetical protein